MSEIKAWRSSALKGLIHVKHGFPFKSEYFADAGKHVVLTPGNFWESGGFKYQPGKEKFYDAQFPADYLHKRGDLIVAMTEQAEGLLGSMAFVPEDGRYLHNQRIGKVTATSGDIDLGFLYYAFRTQSVRTQLSNTASGSKVRHTSPERIYEVSLPLPPVETQKGIAAALSVLDAKIDLNNRINAELEALAKTIYDYWFVQFDFPDDNGRPYKTSGGRMVWNDTLKREIPAGWAGDNIGSVADVLGGGTPTKANNSYWNGDIPFFTPTDATGDTFQLVTEETITESGLANCSSQTFDRGVVFITARGSVGKVVIAGRAMAMNQSCYALRPKTPESYPYVFLHAKRLVHHLKVKASGSTFNSIVTNDIDWTQLVRPPTEKILAFCAVTRPMFERIERGLRENRELTQLRDWLLPLLMNGQVRVA
ncbi:restriction endonuclease subunit S [Sinimarinibacterium flocculans]|uniref:Type I restriction enzyme S subunit n=1 Tax=Sinimarinibacterium flocculans TaxID=985250 RepID=A0A318E9C1_9GAMM|nr:restriction endonuclease subunit S [Sinimarinibacterium flocculans]PXV68525.1 type I restriction enzyme S subunit [Sinimarinibacterium flocculans]